jgi:hypothetical protein
LLRQGGRHAAALQSLQRSSAVHEKVRDHARRYCSGVAFGAKGTLTKHIDVVHLKLREHACP